MQFEGHYSAFIAAVFSPSPKAEFLSGFVTKSEVTKRRKNTSENFAG